MDELCAELELAVSMGNVREVKCQRRALAAGLRQAEEAIMRIAEAHRWTKAELDHALDDVRGHALPQKEEADDFLRADDDRVGAQGGNDCVRAPTW